MQNINFLLSVFLLACSLSMIASAQQANQSDYYYKIPEYPAKYSIGTVTARIIDGLGFRYYWGTEGLRNSDIMYRPGEDARNVMETLQHIYSLTEVMMGAMEGNSFNGVDTDGISYVDMRLATLANIQKISEILKVTADSDIEKIKISFESNGSEFPFWNLLNGPIADMINHVGQVITFRRTNGNPINQNINVLKGSVRN